MRSLGYYKIKQDTLQQHPEKRRRTERTERELFMVRSQWWNKIHNKEKLDKYIDLEKSCLMEKEKKAVKDMLYKYKEALSLRDEG